MQFREIRTPEGAQLEIFKALKKGEYVNGPYVEKVEEKMNDLGYGMMNQHPQSNLDYIK